MLKKEDVRFYPAEEKHLPFLVKWGNLGGLKNQALNKKRTNVLEQEQALQSLSKSFNSELFIICLEDNKVGVCEIYNISQQHKTCWINIYLEDKQGVLAVQGFKIIQLALEYIFHRLGLFKVSVDLLLEDSIGLALYKQLDFQTDVKKRKAAFTGGNYKTVLELSLLRSEFEAQYG